MARLTHDSLSRRERQIMDVIYRRGRATAAEVLEGLPDPPSYSAIRRAPRRAGGARVRHRGLPGSFEAYSGPDEGRWVPPLRENVEGRRARRFTPGAVVLRDHSHKLPWGATATRINLVFDRGR